MEILCLGLSHHTATLDLREKFAIPEQQLGAVAAELARAPGLGEAVIVSTCNRVEFYVGAEDADQGFASLAEFVAARARQDAAAGQLRVVGVLHLVAAHEAL